MAKKFVLKEIQIEQNLWPGRWDLFKQIAAARSVALDIQVVATTEEELVKKSTEILDSDANLILINPSHSDRVLKSLFTSTMTSFHNGACDLLVHEKDSWWPRCLLEDSFVKTISREVKEVEQKKSSLLVGATGAARILAPALTKLGYKKIHIAEESEEIGQKLVRDLKKRIFDVDFRWVSAQEITQLPGDYSILINTLPLSSNSPVLEELYFFNFLAARALVVDLNIIPLKSPLIIEGEKFGTRHLAGAFVAAYKDLVLAKEILGLPIDAEKYTKAFVEAAGKVTFDVTPFLERFEKRGQI